MLIVTPISRLNEVQSVIDAGANELYCGVLTNNQLDSYVRIHCLNRRSDLSSNLTSFAELKEVVSIAHARGVNVNFTLNEFYTDEQFGMVVKQVEGAISAGVDKLIIADVGLLSFLRKEKIPIKIHISTCTSMLTSEAIRFYQQFSPDRIILNRQLSLSEIEHIKQMFPNLEMEVIILNQKCFNIDGLCTFFHNKLSPAYNVLVDWLLKSSYHMSRYIIPRLFWEKIYLFIIKNNHSCCFRYKIRDISKNNTCLMNVVEERFLHEAEPFLFACGLCALYSFSRIGITSLKIVGRSLLSDKVQDVCVLKEALSLLKAAPTEEDYCNQIQGLMHKKYRRRCSDEFCYYYEQMGNVRV